MGDGEKDAEACCWLLLSMRCLWSPELTSSRLFMISSKSSSISSAVAGAASCGKLPVTMAPHRTAPGVTISPTPPARPVLDA